MKFKPNGSWVVLPDPSKKTTDSGIILDDKTAKSITTNILEILATGPQCGFVKVGETVMVDPRAEAMIVHRLMDDACVQKEMSYWTQEGRPKNRPANLAPIPNSLRGKITRPRSK